jgi:hypothetical protein
VTTSSTAGTQSNVTSPKRFDGSRVSSGTLGIPYIMSSKVAMRSFWM